MIFNAFGLNHEQASVKLRERFALDAPAVRDVYAALDLSDTAEVLLLSTCNRTEVYLYGLPEDVDQVKRVLAEKAGIAWPEEHTFSFQDEEAVRHILYVTSGLQSLVLGDAQIFSQVKEAYRLAVEEESIGTVMHRLTHTAFRAAKRVISETDLMSGAASVASVAVTVADRHLQEQGREGLPGKHVLVLGAGKMGRLAVEALLSAAVSRVSLANRSAERALELSHTGAVVTLPWSKRYDVLSEADVVIVATAADEPVVRAEDLVAPAIGAPEKLIIDISVPRNVDQSIDGLEGYRVRDLDYLNTRMVETEGRRRAAVPHAKDICEELLGEFVSWVFHHQSLQPVIQAIRETFEGIRRQEVARHYHRFSKVDWDELDRITSSIIQKLLAVPVVRLKNVNPDSIDYVRGVKLLHALFSRPACEDESVPGDTDAERQAAALLEPQRDAMPAPARCPFHPPNIDLGQASDSVEERLHDALRLFSQDQERTNGRPSQSDR